MVLVGLRDYFKEILVFEDFLEILRDESAIEDEQAVGHLGLEDVGRTVRVEMEILP
jgi:hypothetical protein